MSIDFGKSIEAAMRTIDGLKPGRQRAAMRKAMRVALTPLNRAAKTNARRVSKGLSRSVGSKIQAYPARNVVVGMVGARRNYTDKNGKKPAYLGHLFEFGTKAHSTLGKRAAMNLFGDDHPGTPAKPWLEPAERSTKQEVLKRLSDRLGEEVIVEIKRARKR